jgi:hypothetical protein
LFPAGIKHNHTIRIQGWFEPVSTKKMNEQLERVEEKSATVEVGATVVEPSVHTEEKVRIEEFKISGNAVVAKVKELLHQGNIRSLIVKNKSGRILVEIPLTVGVVGGVVGAVLFPLVAAIAAIGALAANLTIVIARKD